MVNKLFIDLFLIESIPILVAVLIVIALSWTLTKNMHMTGQTAQNNQKDISLIRNLIVVWFIVVLFFNYVIIQDNPKPGLFAIILLLLLIIPIVSYIFLNHIGITKPIIDGNQSSTFIQFQVFRVVGGFFILAFLFGQLSGYFAIPAGLGDIITGIFAIFFGKVIHKSDNNYKQWGYLWNSIGILDLLVAITMGIVTNPGPFQISSLTNAQVTPIYLLPLLIIPSFIVPLALILHLISLQKLRHVHNSHTNPA